MTYFVLTPEAKDWPSKVRILLSDGMVRYCLFARCIHLMKTQKIIHVCTMFAQIASSGWGCSVLWSKSPSLRLLAGPTHGSPKEFAFAIVSNLAFPRFRDSLLPASMMRTPKSPLNTKAPAGEGWCQCRSHCSLLLPECEQVISTVEAT